ncbi:chorismate mutase [Hyphococcus lacteus]|uniref:chorismate mutase n=1 Tax=Hyphococcus lacteus TaxID=3143536 RepID=A0ABV3Z553_9PROT
MRKAADCETMDQVREEIDRVDRALVDLLSERWSYVDRAWFFKRSPDEASVPWRNRDVVDKVKSRAEEAGMPPEMAEALWRQIIGWGIQYEEERLREK